MGNRYKGNSFEDTGKTSLKGKEGMNLRGSFEKSVQSQTGGATGADRGHV